MDCIDLRRGQYRRIYSGCVFGQRINAVSDFAERLFWRMVSITDDFGNVPATPVILRSLAVPLLTRSDQEISVALAELSASHGDPPQPLVQLYSVGSEQFAHLVDHLALQPVPRNGWRKRLYPPSPADAHRSAADPPQAPPSAAKRQHATTTTTTTTTTSSSRVCAEKAAAAGFSKEILDAAARLKITIRDLAAAAGPVDRTELLATLNDLHTRIANGENVRNPVGLLRKMLTEGYCPPASRRTLAPLVRTASPESYALRQRQRSEAEAKLRAQIQSEAAPPLGAELKAAMRRKAAR